MTAVSLCAMFAVAAPALAQTVPDARTQPFRTQEQTIAGLRSLTFVTGGAQPDATLPLVIGLHYSGARAETMLADFAQFDFPARILLPQGRHTRPEGFSWFAQSYSKLNAAEQKTATFQALDEISALVAAATTTFPTAGKPIIVGVSYGGDLSFLLAIHHPDRVRAAFPVAARFLPDWMPAGNGCASPCPLVYAMHGSDDRTVPAPPTRRAAEQLTARGYRVEFHAYPGIPHDFSAGMRRDFTAEVRKLLAPPAR